MKYLLIVSLLSFGFALSPRSGTGTGTQIEQGREIQQTLDLKENQTIISAGSDSAFDWLFGKGYKQWTLTEKDIDNAEKLIKVCFENQKTSAVNKFYKRKPEDYYKQFVGAVNYKGERTIWVNCFCKKAKDDFENWKTDLVVVKDGGNCFFNITINADNNEYYDLNVNGNG